MRALNPNKEYCRAVSWRPLVFNVFIEIVLVDEAEFRQTQTNKKAVLEGKLLAFADDLFIEADNV